MPSITEARTALTPVQAAAASRVDSIMAAGAAADNAMNADGTGTEAQVAAIAEARTALTLVQATAAAASRVISVIDAEAAADDAMNADGAC